MQCSSDFAAAEIFERKHQGNRIGQKDEPADEPLECSKYPSHAQIQFSSDAGGTRRGLSDSIVM